MKREKISADGEERSMRNGRSFEGGRKTDESRFSLRKWGCDWWNWPHNQTLIVSHDLPVSIRVVFSSQPFAWLLSLRQNETDLIPDWHDSLIIFRDSPFLLSAPPFSPSVIQLYNSISFNRCILRPLCILHQLDPILVCSSLSLVLLRLSYIFSSSSSSCLSFSQTSQDFPSYRFYFSLIISVSISLEFI